MKPSPTRTVHPLHFEDLDHRRFEDLVRQLVYQSRSWVTLEALGLSGADDGVDIRGVERVRQTDTGDDPPGEDLHTWFVQCKRVKALGPAKAREIAAAAIAGTEDPPFGFLLAAPCALSKRTRDLLAEDLRAGGVSQIIVWGRTEIEDQLYLPENDHLLFAYFGLSLQVQRRRRATELRSRLARKREVFRSLGGLDHKGRTRVLLRDPSEPDYPFRDRVADFDESNPPWMSTVFARHSNPDMVALVFRRYHARISKSRKRYDFVDTYSNLSADNTYRSPLYGNEEALRVWRYFHSDEVPQDERAWLEVVGWIPLDDILLVDDLGDAFNPPPHLLVARDHEHGFFSETRSFLTPTNGQPKLLKASELRKAKLIPDEIPDVEESERW